MTPAEQSAVRIMIWASAGAAAAVPLLIAPPTDDPMLPFTLHLIAVTVFIVALTFHLAPISDREWFSGTSLSMRARWALAGVWTVVLVTGATGLVALATAAGLRFDPSLQFLAVLSALDIAWVTAAIGIGARKRWGGGAGVAGALMIGTVCVWSIWRYLDTVGFAADGGWAVDGGEIARLVLPFDVMAAVIAAVVFSAGVRSVDPGDAGVPDHAGGRTEQPSAQS